MRISDVLAGENDTEGPLLDPPAALQAGDLSEATVLVWLQQPVRPTPDLQVLASSCLHKGRDSWCSDGFEILARLFTFAEFFTTQVFDESVDFRRSRWGGCLAQEGES